MALGQGRQTKNLVPQRFGHASTLCELEPGMQGGELDRNPGALDRSQRARLDADRLDRGFVGLKVAVGVSGRSGPFAQHVVAETVAAADLGIRTFQGLFDGLTENELMTENPHGPGHRVADHRLAQPRHQAIDHSFGILQVKDPSGDDQAPGGGIDEQRMAVAEMPMPVATGDLVAYQAIRRCRVRHPQQSLGQTHQGNAFGIRKVELVHQGIDAPPPGAACAYFLDHRHGIGGNPRRLRRIQPRLGNQCIDGFRFIGTVQALDGGAATLRMRKIPNVFHAPN